MAGRALITGITGQDGAYLARLLLAEGHAVFGAYRRNSTPNLQRLHALAIADRVTLVPFDITEITNLIRLLETIRPDEVYHMAAQSFVPLSFELPVYTGQVNAMGSVSLLEAVRRAVSECHYYQASTSEMFGAADSCPQSERTVMRPCSPYADAKAYAHFMTGVYRDAHGLHASSGILFNHESPLRGPEFLTRKVSLAFSRMRHGSRETLTLGNLDARRDWGYAEDYMSAVITMIRQKVADDYVVATGESHSVREWVQRSAEVAGFSLAWEGEGLAQRALDRDSGRVVVMQDANLFRPAEVIRLQGDASKAHRVLGWSPRVKFDALVNLVVSSDLAATQTDFGLRPMTAAIAATP